MSMISSDSLFHFTDSAEKLINILKNEFYPRYNSEEPTKGTAYPMVCFCDIPLSQIKKHIEKYGDYGIGMSKKWAKKKGLNPVLYFEKRSALFKYIEIISDNLPNVSLEPELLKDELKKVLTTKIPTTHIKAKIASVDAKTKSAIKAKIADLNTRIADLEAYESALKAEIASTGAFMNVLSYIKPYEGDLYRSARIFRKVRFYDEREWRYVPSFEKCRKCGSRFYLSEEQLQNPTKITQENAKIEKAKLSFEPNDIKYIIIKKDEEILRMAKELEDIKGKYSFETVKILTTRIITSEQIENDF